MKVVVYSKPFFPKMGGLERNTLTLCLALNDLGHRVQLVTETPSDEPDEYPFSVIRTQSLAQFFRVLSGADWLIVNGNVSLRMHPHAWLQRSRYATIFHTFRGYERQGNGAISLLENKIRKTIARQADANIFTSVYGKQQVDLPEETAHVVLNPVDKEMERYYNRTGEQDRFEGAPFLFAGRLIEGKGLLVLAEALSLLDENMSLRVKVAGEGRDADRFRKQTQSLSTIQVDLLGRLEAPELVEQYQRARALIVPSTTHKEGNPLVIAEALYAGTPVIASDQPPMVESVGDAGMTVEQENAEALAHAMRKMQQNEEAYHRFRAKAERRAETFSYERYRHRIREIFGTGEGAAL